MWRLVSGLHGRMVRGMPTTDRPPPNHPSAAARPVRARGGPRPWPPAAAPLRRPRPRRPRRPRPRQQAAATPTAAASATPVASKGPASATLGIVGTAGLTGPITAQTITCNRPALTGGPEIFFIGQAGTNGPSIIIFLQAATMQVRVGTGSASTLRLRQFTGTGREGLQRRDGGPGGLAADRDDRRRDRHRRPRGAVIDLGHHRLRRRDGGDRQPHRDAGPRPSASSPGRP